MDTAEGLVGGALLLLIVYGLFLSGGDKVIDRIVVGACVTFIFVVSMMMAIAALFVS